MPEHDAVPDPMDKAYLQAEALMTDDDARAARRARVLDAVLRAETAAPAAPARPRSLWRRGSWLAAASVAGVSVLIATQIDPPKSFDPPSERPSLETPAPPAVAPAIVAPLTPRKDPTVRTQQAPARSRTAPAQAAPSQALEVPAVPSAPTERRLALAPPAPPAGLPADSQKSEVSEVVVTASRREADLAAPQAAYSRGSPGDLAMRLRDAAAAGRTRELTSLLARGVPVDATDDDGETALMKSIQAGRTDAAALLQRRGASLDHKNRGGRSARDMAVDLRDPKLNQALGLDPQ